MILPADKGRATVVMPKGMYNTKALELLQDRKTYMPLKKDPTSRYSTKLIDLLKNLKKKEALTKDQYRALYPTVQDIPKFYGLPKVHKKEGPLPTTPPGLWPTFLPRW